MPITKIPKESFDHLIGRQVGTCTIVRELGRGSMGVVYVGYQSSLKRPVAIKVLPKEVIKNPIAVERFRAEAETVAILSHPNIIPIYEVGETETFYYQIMQLVKGISLLQLLNRVRKHVVPSKRVLPISQTIELLLQVLDGLDYAHQEGIIHRDIKPANILLEEHPRRVLITDFGIAKELRGEDLDVGMILGTPLYMSPEQAAMKEVDGRSDMYSVGCMLFEMAAGSLPVYAESGKELMARKIKDPSGIFSKRPSEVNPRIDRRLEEIILKATAYRPEDRFETCRAFMDALTSYRSAGN